MADEKIDIYDEKNLSSGEVRMKSEAHREGLWHRAAHIWIYTENSELLIQKRAPEKDLYPNLWDLAGTAGHIGAGEREIIAALRELEEEVGIFAMEEDLEFVGIKKHSGISGNIKNNEHRYIYLYKFDGEIGDLKIQEEEVAGIKLIDIEVLKKDLTQKPEIYLPKTTYWDEMLGEIKGRF